MEPISWQHNKLRILDQASLPGAIAHLEASTHQEVIIAIQRLQVRGAPLIGIAGAYALVLAALNLRTETQPSFLSQLNTAAAEIEAARPTAVNLSWAVRRLLARAQGCQSSGEAAAVLLAEAQALAEEERGANLRMGQLGAALLPDNARVLTHCNTGALATGGIGTALGIIRTAWSQRKLAQVYVTETRPLLQGARLTAWELAQAGIPATLIVDGAAGQLLHCGRLDAVIVGADRIAANGDTANKIGTYSLAVLAKENGTPFYVAAPSSTIDTATPGGETISIEQRGEEEVLFFAGARIAALGVEAENSAFDVTPARYISAIITERGVARESYQSALVAMFAAEASVSG